MTFLIAAPAAAQQVTVGFVTTLTGPGAGAGRDLLDGFMVGLRHANGKLGGIDTAVIVADDNLDAAQARASAERMVTTDHVRVVVGGTGAEVSAALARAVAEAHTPFIALGAVPAEFAGSRCNAFLFGLNLPAPAIHEAAALHFNAEGMRRVAVAGPDTAASRAAREVVKAAFKGVVVDHPLTKPGRMDYHDDIAALRLLQPDAVYSLYGGGMGAAFLTQYAEAAPKAEAPLYGPWMTLDSLAMPAALDVTSVGVWSPESESGANRRMIADFEAEFGRQATAHAAVGYDAAVLLDAAVRAAGGKQDRDSLRNAIRTAEFPSVRGGMRFNSNQFPIQSVLLHRVVRDARGRYVNELQGVAARDHRDRQAAECPLR